MNEHWETLMGVIITALSGAVVTLGIAIRQWIVNRKALILARIQAEKDKLFAKEQAEQQAKQEQDRLDRVEQEKCRYENINALSAIIRGLVMQAEQVFPPLKGIEKLDYVQKHTRQVCLDANLWYDKDWVEQYVREIVDFSKFVNKGKTEAKPEKPQTVNIIKPTKTVRTPKTN